MILEGNVCWFSKKKHSGFYLVVFWISEEAFCSSEYCITAVDLLNVFLANGLLFFHHSIEILVYTFRKVRSESKSIPCFVCISLLWPNLRISKTYAQFDRKKKKRKNSICLSFQAYIKKARGAIAIETSLIFWCALLILKSRSVQELGIWRKHRIVMICFVAQAFLSHGSNMMIYFVE